VTIYIVIVFIVVVDNVVDLVNEYMYDSREDAYPVKMAWWILSAR
jgi:hypothetical protein